MNRLITFLCAVPLLLTISTCNIFEPIDVSVNHLDRCKGFNDKGDYIDAVKECQAADPDGIDPEAQLELGDASLSAIGISIKQLSDVFLQSTQGYVTIVNLADSVIAAGKVNTSNAEEAKAYAKQAVTAFDNYGALLGGSAASVQVAAFYSTLVRVCYIALLMAYADIGGDQNGHVTSNEICSAATCGTPMCINNISSPFYNGPCGGMSDADAAEAGQTIIEMNAKLTKLGLGDLQKAVEDMGGIQVANPETGTYVLIQNMPTAYKSDSGRQILWEMTQ